MDNEQGSRPGVERENFAELASMAAIIFLCLMAAGALLLVAGKLQFPSLGAGSAPLDVLRAIGLIALAALGVTIDLDGLELRVVPLGALMVVAVVAKAMTQQVFKDGLRSKLEPWLVGLVVGLLASFSTLVFRFVGEAPISANTGEAFFYGSLWGSVVAMIGLRGTELSVPSRPHWLGDGFRVAAPACVSAATGALIVLVSLVIARLASDPLPRSFELGDAAAAVLYLIAFLPNVLVAIFSLAVGASLEVGAQFDVGGELVGPLKSISMWDWGGAPIARWFLLLLPLTVSIQAGSLALRRASSPASALRSVVTGAALVALAVGLLAAIGDARLGAGLVRQNGVGLVAINAFQATALAFSWITIGGVLTVVLTLKARQRRGGRSS